MTETSAVLPSRRPSRLRRIVKILVLLLVAVVLVAAAALLWGRGKLKGSLAQLDGEARLTGLSGEVTIDRDALGVPTLRGADRRDLAQALGFLHAQDRFFQMDLTRRQGAGELAELIGAVALPIDRANRVHRFRSRAEARVASLPPAERDLLQAYTDGVNQGLQALGDKPFEYFLLGVEPTPWKPEDSFLTAYAMYFELQDEDGSSESALGTLYAAVPEGVADFLAPRGTQWDAPVDGSAIEPAGVPGPELLDLRDSPSASETREVAAWRPDDVEAVRLSPGSNNWAVAGEHTAHGGALVAGDMHLGIQVPNTWYRVSMVLEDGGQERRITGVTLPGVHFVVAGSNGQVAWAFTNSYGDWTDLVVLEPVPGDPDAYQTPDGPRSTERIEERIAVKDGEYEVFVVEETIWGPIIEEVGGQRRALRWVAHDPPAVNFALGDIERATSLEEAVEVANRSGVPAQNFVVGDRSGRVGWTIIGAIPRRVGFDGRLPVSWADGSRGWDGYYPPEESPRFLDPENGRIWTANSRVVGGEGLRRIGDGGYDLGARGMQIRDGLLAVEKAGLEDMLAVQLDDRALFLERWRTLLLEVLTPEAVAGEPARDELRRLATDDWNGRASVDSVGYRMVRGYRLSVLERVMAPFQALGRKVDPEFRVFALPQAEGPLWALMEERPMHLLDPQYKSWDALLIDAVDGLIADLGAGEPGKLAGMTWGRRNTARIRHPLSRALPPALAKYLDMPFQPLPGDANMPRVQGVTFGASQRLGVSPGREEEGFFHMPGGQSGHPLSPFYRAGHDAWAEGRPTPFLPGPVRHTLTLQPAGEE